MRSAPHRRRISIRVAQLLGATMFVGAIGYAVVTAQAQTLPTARSTPAGSYMTLEADTLVYDNDQSLVTAAGGVQIVYGGYHVVAQKVVYNRKTGRLLASGKVEIVDPDGTQFFADEVDLTDDFGDGFVNTLQVVTTDKTYFGSESAERQSGVLTTFNNGVYTACAPCEEHPDKAPIWRIKAQKIIWNGKTKTIRFERSRFEMFGLPIAFIPAFEVADPTVKRKSGFLMPGFDTRNDLGFGLSIPYYFALSPTYDLTLTGTGYTKQGFLGEAEWRQRFNNGEYMVKLAGIYQSDPEQFKLGSVDRGIDGVDPNRFRGMIGTKGDFKINPRWSFGWNILAQTDKDFSYIYGINGFGNYVQQSQIYLTGLNDRNYFDLRAMKFDVQEEFDDLPSSRDDKQPYVLPVFDYSYTPDEPVAGGELNIDISSRVTTRSEEDYVPAAPVVRGIEGTSGRVTAEAEWRRSLYTDGGLVVTPELHVQGDTMVTDASAASIASIQAMGGILGVDEDVRSELYRYMATAGLEVRWPLLFSTSSSTHVLEPIAQVFARPDEQYSDKLVIPNEDAQSFVFDASTLFERDKFSGYDRIEGGSRVNVGLRYVGSYTSGWTTNGIVGQSYQIAGVNSFASPDLVNAGAYSGLETATSDYVGLVGFTAPFGLSGSVSTRLDEESLEMRRTELRSAYSNARLSLYGKYAFIQAQPLYGFATDREQLSGGGSLTFADNWRVFASGTYDMEQDAFTNRGAGFSYSDECYTYQMTYSESFNKVTDDHSTNVGFYVSFRTLGDFGNAI